MKLNLIIARSSNGVIGENNSMPWHLPEDLAHFKKTTLGKPIIMGRRTWDSLPPKIRPLPGRLNIVLTRQDSWSSDGATKASSISQAINLAEQSGTDEAWVIGGAEVYGQVLDFADLAVVTEIDREFPGDAFAPTFGPNWEILKSEAHQSSTGLKFSFVTYTQKRGA